RFAAAHGDRALHRGTQDHLPMRFQGNLQRSLGGRRVCQSGRPGGDRRRTGLIRVAVWSVLPRQGGAFGSRRNGREMTTRTIATVPESTARKLRRYNAAMGLLHAVQGIAVVALANGFTLPVVATFMTGQP